MGSAAAAWSIRFMELEPIIKIRRALISVSDKRDLIPFAKALASRGIEIISTGGTARALSDAGVPVTPIDQVTGFPEIMDGRVKTLHPKIHGALLGRRDVDSHVNEMKTHGLEPIDLVCVSLYPFEQTVARGDEVTRDEIVEYIDIGGPSMIRSAAKNHEFVTVVTSSKQYDLIIRELAQRDGATSFDFRVSLAATAFSKTAEYDATIASWMHRKRADDLGDQMRVNYTKVLDLRYGENPHQTAALYRDPTSHGPTVVNSKQLYGKPLSYNNIHDAAAALAVVRDFGNDMTVSIVKHANPCGVAVGTNLSEVFEKAYSGDPQAAYGGIVATNHTIDLDTAKSLAEGSRFFEVIVASGYDNEALEILKARWKNIRLLATGNPSPSPYPKVEYRSVPGGMLVQNRDLRTVMPQDWSHAAGPDSNDQMRADSLLVWLTCKHLRSNAIAIGGDQHIYGVGCGQVDRVTACRIAVDKAGSRTQGAIAASDAFFPFPDGPEVLINAGVQCIIQPGGSKRDQDTFDLCNERGVTCLLTGIRHFRH